MLWRPTSQEERLQGRGRYGRHLAVFDKDISLDACLCQRNEPGGHSLRSFAGNGGFHQPTEKEIAHRRNSQKQNGLFCSISFDCSKAYTLKRPAIVKMPVRSFRAATL